MDAFEWKKALHEHLRLLQQEKLANIKAEIAEVRAGQADNGKSAMGDKYETSGEMARQELDKLRAQEALLQQHLVFLSKIAPKKKSSAIVPGALIQAGEYRFYLSIPLGKISLSGKEVYCISLASPIGQALQKAGRSGVFVFNEVELKVEEVW